MRSFISFVIAGLLFSFALLNLSWGMYFHAGMSFLGAAGWYLAFWTIEGANNAL